MPNGYGILTYSSGIVYRGELKNDYHDGYGLMKFPNNDEYDGQWKDNMRHIEGVFKKASTGRIERRRYYNDVVIEVLEVIEQGQ